MLSVIFVFGYTNIAGFPIVRGGRWGGRPPPPHFTTFFENLPHQNQCLPGVLPPLKNEALPPSEKQPLPHWNMKHPSKKLFLEKAQ